MKLESNFQHVYPLVLYVSCMPASRICRLQNSFYLLTTSSWQQKTIVHNIKIKEVMYNLEVRNIKLYQMLKLYYCYNYNSQQQLKQYVYYSSWIMFNSLKLVTFKKEMFFAQWINNNNLGASKKAWRWRNPFTFKCIWHLLLSIIKSICRKDRAQKRWCGWL